MSFPLLLLGFLAPILGVLLTPLARRTTSLFHALDGLVVVSIAGVLGLHVLPWAIGETGWAGVGLVLLGLVAPLVAERAFSTTERAHARVHGFILVLVALGVGVHEFFDGIALSLTGHHADDGHGHHHHELEAGAMLALGTLLHRLPVGLAIGWALVPRRGLGRALGVAAAMSVATVLGYWVGHEGGGLTASGTPLPWLECLVTGGLLHVLFHHRPATGALTRRNCFAAGVGALLGAAAMATMALTHSHEHGEGPLHGAGALALELALESAPALLVAFAGAGLLHGFLSSAATEWLARGPVPVQAARGMIFGLPLPICSCGVLPLYRGLLAAGAPPAAAMAFLVATPEIGLDAILISLPLLGAKLTGFRLVAAALTALFVASLVAPMIRGSRPIVTGRLVAARGAWPQRLRRGMTFGFTELVDHTLPWIVLGLLIAAVVGVSVDLDVLTALPAWAQVPLAAAVGVPMYVCASGATPLAAVLLAAGLSPGAAIAFLLTGPATNISTFGVLADMHGRRTAAAFGVAAALAAVGLGLATDLALGGWIPRVGTGDAHAHGAIQWVSLGGLALVTLSALLRRGPRALLDEVLPAWIVGDGDCGHAHDHEGHDHAHAHAGGSCCGPSTGCGAAEAPRTAAPGSLLRRPAAGATSERTEPLRILPRPPE